MAGMILWGVAAALLLFPAFQPPAAAVTEEPPQMVGGPCDYAAFPGTAEFTGVVPASPDEIMDTPYQAMKATFRFIPDKPLKEQGIYAEGRTYALTMASGALPGKAFLEKYGVRPGARIPCSFKVIKKGTCTPTLFTFPGIDQADYFEWKK